MNEIWSYRDGTFEYHVVLADVAALIYEPNAPATSASDSSYCIQCRATRTFYEYMPEASILVLKRVREDLDELIQDLAKYIEGPPR
jgi:hypothetical protein